MNDSISWVKKLQKRQKSRQKADVTLLYSRNEANQQHKSPSLDLGDWSQEVLRPHHQP